MLSSGSSISLVYAKAAGRCIYIYIVLQLLKHKKEGTTLDIMCAKQQKEVAMSVYILFRCLLASVSMGDEKCMSHLLKTRLISATPATDTAFGSYDHQLPGPESLHPD